MVNKTNNTKPASTKRESCKITRPNKENKTIAKKERTKQTQGDISELNEIINIRNSPPELSKKFEPLFVVVVVFFFIFFCACYRVHITFLLVFNGNFNLTVDKRKCSQTLLITSVAAVFFKIILCACGRV